MIVAVDVELVVTFAHEHQNNISSHSNGLTENFSLFFFSEFRQILTMNLFLCEIAAVPWLQLAFETFLHWGLILLFIDVNWNFFSSNHFRREVRYCNEKEIHVEELTYLDFTWNLLYLVINIKKSVDNFVITKCGLTSICHFHEILFWNLKQICRNSVKPF